MILCSFVNNVCVGLWLVLGWDTYRKCTSLSNWYSIPPNFEALVTNVHIDPI
jgi:hypothetical protein